MAEAACRLSPSLKIHAGGKVGGEGLRMKSLFDFTGLAICFSRLFFLSWEDPQTSGKAMPKYFFHVALRNWSDKWR